MTRSRKILLGVALALFALVVLLELGMAGSLATEAQSGAATPVAGVRVEGADAETTGLALRSLAIIDGLMLLGVVLMVLGELLAGGIYGRLQAAVSLVGAIVALMLGIAGALAAVAVLMLMVSLLLAVPFGTAIYMAIFGHFGRGEANLLLGALMVLRLAGGVSLLLWHPPVLKAKALVLLLLTCLVANLIVSFLLGIVPVPLASITDAIGAIVVCVIACIWAVVFIVFGIMGVLRAVASVA